MVDNACRPYHSNVVILYLLFHCSAFRVYQYTSRLLFHLNGAILRYFNNCNVLHAGTYRSYPIFEHPRRITHLQFGILKQYDLFTGN